MEKNNDIDNKSESKLSTSNPTEVVETVEKPKKQKRKFEWTPKRKAAFEKCVAARKSQIEPKPKLKTIKEEEDDSSVSTANSSLSSSSEEYKKPKRKGLKKQFYRLKKDLIYNMKKQLKKKNVYDDDLDYPDYIPAYYSHPPPSSRGTQQLQQQQEQQEQQEEKQTSNKPRYCFL